MEWSNNRIERSKQVRQAFKELGFDGLPETEEQLKAFDEKFKDYPYECDSSKIDINKIIKSKCNCKTSKPNYPEMIWCDNCGKEI